MKNGRLIFFILILVLCTFGSIVNAQIAVIVNKSNPTNNLSLDDLKNIYLGKVSTFSNSNTIILAEFAPLKKKFYKIVANKSVNGMKKYWISYVLSGKSATPPTERKDVEKVKSFVSQNRNAICFLDVSHIDSSVKVLTIEKKKLGSARYPLK